MNRMYFTITGLYHYYGDKFLEKGMNVTLEKDVDNKHDNEAITVKIEGLGKIEYVANSHYTVLGECMSAGRLYDKIGDVAIGKIIFITDCGIVGSIEDSYVKKEEQRRLYRGQDIINEDCKQKKR